MIEKLIRAAVVAVVLYLIYIVAGMVMAALSLPTVFLMIVAVLLLLAFILFVVRLFGINI
jgi:hypothetical protein